MPYNKKFSYGYNKKPVYSGANLEYKKFRVKSAVRSFRDLEVYIKTNRLASEIFKLELPKSCAAIKSELETLKNSVQAVPMLIAESYGDKFSDLTLSLNKLEKACQIISGAITKIDFLVISIEEADIKETLNRLLKQYQTQRIKILNLKRAWMRVFGGSREYGGGKVL